MAGSGTVTSVAAAADSAGVVSWSGSPITASGTFTPTFAKASTSQFGVVEPDGTTITASGGVLSAVGGGGSQTPWTSAINAAGYGLDNAGYLVASNFANPPSLLTNLFLGSNVGNYTMTGGSNAASGWSCLQSNTTGTANTAVGIFALADNTTGYGNTALGKWALRYNLSGSDNTALGNNSEASTVMTGSQNTAVGSSTLDSLSSGAGNTALGYQALINMASGSYNVGLGYHTLFNATGNSYNVAAGYNAMSASLPGSGNVAIGYDSAYSLNAGSNNVALGYQSLYYNLARLNIAIGFGAGLNLTNGSNNIYIGNWPTSGATPAQQGVDTTNTTYLGNGQTICYVSGVVVASGGFESTLTNVLSPTANAWSTTVSTLNSGYTNLDNYGEEANVAGTSGSVIFWYRGGVGGVTPAANPLWTNSITAGAVHFSLGTNCGFQIVSGVGVYTQVYAP